MLEKAIFRRLLPPYYIVYRDVKSLNNPEVCCNHQQLIVGVRATSILDTLLKVAKLQSTELPRNMTQGEI